MTRAPIATARELPVKVMLAGAAIAGGATTVGATAAGELAVKRIKIGPGEHHVTGKAGELIITVLGSCVAACIRDPTAGVGGMNHFMLPESATGVWGEATANLRYGNFAMERLINDILCRGGRRNRLEVKVFGGAAMLAGGPGIGAGVGGLNAEFVEAYLQAEGLAIQASHLGGLYARRIEYSPLDGRVRMLEMRSGTADLAHAEASFRSRLQHAPVEGSIELFD